MNKHTIFSSAFLSAALFAGVGFTPARALGDEISPHTDGTTTPSGLPKAATGKPAEADGASSGSSNDGHSLNDAKPQGSMFDRRGSLAMPSSDVDDEVTDSETVDQDDMDFSGFGREEAEKAGE